MHTTHSLAEMEMTSRTPTTRIERDLLRELGPGGLDRALNDLERAKRARAAGPGGAVRRLVRRLLSRLDDALGPARTAMDPDA